MRKLYIDCCGGLSGDMLVAALIDLGVKTNKITEAFDTFTVRSGKELSYKISYEDYDGVKACEFNVICDESEKTLEAATGNAHTRSLEEVHEMLDMFDMSGYAKTIARRIYNIIAGSEATVYSMNPGDIKLFEDGSLQTIACIAAFAICFDTLEAHEVIVPRIVEGSGEVMTHQGERVVPAPLISQIAGFYNLPIEKTGTEGELITSVGASMMAAVITDTKPIDPEEVKDAKKSIGLGQCHLEKPALIKAFFVE